MALELTRLGFTAVDTDDFAGQETATGIAVDRPETATDDWLLSHRWALLGAISRVIAALHDLRPRADGWVLVDGADGVVAGGGQ